MIIKLTITGVDVKEAIIQWLRVERLARTDVAIPDDAIVEFDNDCDDIDSATITWNI
jgi:hypothetical protein